MKLRILLFLNLALLFSVNGFAKEKDNQIKRIFLANVEYGRGVTKEDAALSKFDAALSITANLSGKYSTMSIISRDSVADYIQKSGDSPTALAIAKNVNADGLVFVRVDRLKNVLRIELSLVDKDNPKNKKVGEGYAFLNFKNIEKGTELYDPSIMTAMQRAFAVAIKDSMIFDTISGAFGVKPVPTVAICGIGYPENETRTQANSIFFNRTIGSFAAAESIFDMARRSRDYMVYDIETRDTIYTFFRLFSVENCNYPTFREIDALKKFGIKYIITGFVSKDKDSIALELRLSELRETEVKQISSVKSMLYNDDQKEYENKITTLTKELLKIPDIKEK